MYRKKNFCLSVILRATDQVYNLERIVFGNLANTTVIPEQMVTKMPVYEEDITHSLTKMSV